MDLKDQARATRDAGRALLRAGTAARVAALHRVAEALVSHADRITEANRADLADADVAVAAGELEPALRKRLELSEARIHELAEGIRAVAAMDEPVGQVLRRTAIAEGLVLEQQTCPIGVLLVIFESRPDALPQIASLALRSGNGLILKGGREAARSNAALHAVISEALAPDLPAEAITLVQTREEVGELLKLDGLIDLVIPRGSNALVRHIMERSRIPVLGHADGVCHVYVDAMADPQMAARIARDSKCDYPAACNALETLLLHRSHLVGGALPGWLTEALAGVELYAAPADAAGLGLPAAADLHHEYGRLACTIALVDDVNGAVAHVNQHGSGHTEAIVTADEDAAEVFQRGVDSACVFWNASTRFADGFRFGLGAEVGISTSRLHARGPVGVEGLLTTRWQLQGQGQTVEDTRSGRVRYVHRDLPLD